MGRFDPPADPTNAELREIRNLLGQLTEAMRALNVSPQVEVPTPSVSVSGPQVNVPVEPLVEVVSRIEQALAETVGKPQQISVEAPPINFDGVTADVDLTALLDSAEQQRLLLQAVKEKIGNLKSGTRSHFDGRLRNNNGLIEGSNPLATSDSVSQTSLSNLESTFDGTNLLGYVSSDAVRRSALGQVYLGTTDVLNAGLGESIRATIENPAGSGVNILLVRLVATSEGAGQVVTSDTYINPDTNVPTTSFTPFNTLVGGPAANGVFKADTGAGNMSGGTLTDLHIALGGSRERTEISLDAPVIVTPGVTLGIDIPLGATQTTNGAFAAYWIEDPI